MLSTTLLAKHFTQGVIPYNESTLTYMYLSPEVFAESTGKPAIYITCLLASNSRVNPSDAVFCKSQIRSRLCKNVYINLL